MCDIRLRVNILCVCVCEGWKWVYLALNVDCTDILFYCVHVLQLETIVLHYMA